MEIDGACTEIENPGTLVGRLAIGCEFQHVDFPKRQIRRSQFCRMLWKRLCGQCMQMLSYEDGKAEILVQLKRTDGTMAPGQAQDAEQAAFIVMQRLRPAVLKSLNSKRFPHRWDFAEKLFTP
ncbi:hypothetical protein D3C76_845270 [compost metagenome]